MIKRSQKCGICQENINIAIKMICGDNKSAPPAVHPIIGGTAPTKAPGRIDKGLFVFKGVYAKLYKSKFVNPSIAGTRPMENKIRNPKTAVKIEINKANFADILPEGIGLF
jgi:hypothetical protein